jgi:hypothetical protein
MLANNTSYEDSFTTCQITPENHRSLLGSLLNMQLASRNPFSGQIFFCKVYSFNMHFDFRPPFRITFAELSLFTAPGHQQGVHWRKSEDRGPWCLARAKPHLWKLRYCYSHSQEPCSCRTPGASGWQPFTYNDYNTQLSRNFREVKFYFRELKKTFARVHNITWTVFATKILYQDLLDRLPVVLGWFYIENLDIPKTSKTPIIQHNSCISSWFLDAESAKSIKFLLCADKRIWTSTKQIHCSCYTVMLLS